MNNLISGVNKDFVHEMYNYPIVERDKKELIEIKKPTVVKV